MSVRLLLCSRCRVACYLKVRRPKHNLTIREYMRNTHLFGRLAVACRRAVNADVCMHVLHGAACLNLIPGVLMVLRIVWVAVEECFGPCWSATF